MRPTMVRRISLFCVVFISVVAISQTAPRPISETDLFRFVWIGDPQISPDGSRVAFVRVSVNEKKIGYDTAIWLVPTTGNQPAVKLTSGAHDSAPRWSPDGNWLLFVRGQEKEGKPEPTQLALLPMNGGEARVVTNMPKGAGSPTWSPDGKSILFTSATTPEEWKKAQQEKPAEKSAEKPGPNEEKLPATTAGEEHESDVRIITRAVYRDNDEGYLDPKHHSHIWTIPVPQSSDDKPLPVQITSGEFDEGDPQWSRDGQRIYFTSTRVAEPYYNPTISELYQVSAKGGDVQKVAGISGVIGDYAQSPDGKTIAFTGQLSTPVLSYAAAHLVLVNAAPGSTPKDITPSSDADIGGGIGSDQHPPRAGGGQRLFWVDNGRAVVQIVAEKGAANLRRFDLASGRVDPVTTGNQEVVSWSATPDGTSVVLNVSTATNIGDLFTLGAGGKLTRLTNVNEKLMSELKLTAPEDIWFKSFDGKQIQAWVQKPPDFQEGKKYPLILNIHGGPHSAYGWTFFHEMQWMAAKGYVVLYPNPRGSTSYGQEFGNIIQYRYPGDDFKDLMAGVDELIRRGWVDPNKLAVTGGSGGGLLTNWTVVQTDRFKAAVSQRDISDWASWWYTADFTMFQPMWFRGTPFQDPADYAQRSPITYVAKVKTPMMFILGEADYRTPPGAGGEQMFRALKFRKIPTVMVRFPGESHELSRSGQPWHRVERLQNIVKWFDIYLQGQPNIYEHPTQESVPAVAKPN
jgi:dipeptidyl aminopeptidase/acylaminoacyl peptidase